MRTYTLAIALSIPFLLHGQGGPPNLNFELGAPGQTPPGWFVPTRGYTAQIQTQGCRTSRCAVLSPPEALSPDVPFGNLMQTFKADSFRGKTVRLRAWIRVDTAAPADQAQMWLRVDSPERADGSV